MIKSLPADFIGGKLNTRASLWSDVFLWMLFVINFMFYIFVIRSGK